MDLTSFYSFSKVRIILDLQKYIFVNAYVCKFIKQSNGYNASLVYLAGVSRPSSFLYPNLFL